MRNYSHYAMMRLKYVFAGILAVGLLVACDRELSDLQGDEQAKLNAWVQVHNIPAEALKPSGLYYISTQEGTGLTPAPGDFVVYSYEEQKLNGVTVDTDSARIARLYGVFSADRHYTPVFTKFENSNDKIEGYNGMTMPLGLREGLGYMKEGGKATLIMPSSLAYGTAGRTVSSTVKINSYESVIYRVTLLKVVKNPRSFEKDLLLGYINANYPGLTPINDSIYYVQLSPPTSSTVTVGKDSVVWVYYKGMFPDGFVFDTNIDSVAKRLGRTFNSTDSLKVTIGQGVVAGFSQALTQMKKGEWGRAIIPSFCGYDSTGNEKIPPFSTLVFDIYFSCKDSE